MTESTSSELKKNFKETLNLPHTDFAIRPNHIQDNETIIKRWQEEDLFHQSFIHNQGKEKFILHDGPPYANGHIHLGHAYNKVLKDIVGKSQRMLGKHVPITPGWDCHGLPIELKVIKEFPNLPSESIKKQCRLYAHKWIDIQREEFKKLGVLMNWDKPYLTMDHSYEADIVRAFGKFYKEGYIEKKKKTVAWCFHDKTVLATAEIEYKERKDPSIYLRFGLNRSFVQSQLPAYQDIPVSILVWTTTPWTLPLNRAVLLKPTTTYDVLYNKQENELLIVASALADKVCSLKGIEKDIVATIPSETLATTNVKHPFIANLTVPIILDHSVMLQDGTAAVHCAPGCGPIDYEVAIKHGLEIFSPISPDGKYTVGIEPQELEGKSITDGQGWVLKTITDNGALYFKDSIRHSYPHCWRCHEGLIFRATNQWFCSLTHNGLRERALAAVDALGFLPQKSINYLKATIESRIEWCLSRQRIWGVPIPALICTNCRFVHTSSELIENVAQGIEKEGVEYWDTVSVNDLGIGSLSCKQCHGNSFSKEKDILDVWFDSGISHFPVLYNNPVLKFPADIYLEGIDQHRGWFQSSLLTSLVLEKEPCTRTFVTHGFIVDERGHKMSKSIGNVVSPNDLVDKLGTDGLRLWASSIDYAGDAVVSDTLLKNVAHVFQKIRNTCRFLLANLYDFDSDKDAVPLNQMFAIDHYALAQLYEINTVIQHDYIQYDFTGIFHKLGDFCSVTLSALYLDVIKDRLYTAQADGKERRSAQTACWHILDTLTKLMAPILSLTAEQISDHYQKNKTKSIHLQEFNTLSFLQEFLPKEQSETTWYLRSSAQQASTTITSFNRAREREDQWELMLDIRSALLKAIELQREQGVIKHSLEARVRLFIKLPQDKQLLFDNFIAALQQSGQDLSAFFKEFLIVSEITRLNEQQITRPTEMEGLFAYVDHAQGTKCPRCWQWEVTDNADGLCKRCESIVAAIKKQ